MIMSFSTFLSEQAKNPSGIFGRLIMSVIFDKGNAYLNGFVNELMSIQANDHVLEIGFGTGKLIYEMARKINHGCIEGIDISNTMVSIAQRKNKKYIADGKVQILACNFDEMPFKNKKFTKICSVNTIYFWPEPENTAKKIAGLLSPGGKFVVAFEDIDQLERRNLNRNVFQLYSKSDVIDLLINAGFTSDVSIESRVKGKSTFHCAVATR
ncbi:MAG: class I SAM-dependent methyltransferase [Desulfobacula sp.]|nr:class I SAM-dependent methyltransferase [Desulfobacula sp.]